MKNKFLSKFMIVAVVLCSMLFISACSWQKDVNIKSIEVVEESIPTIIRVGEFDNAGIQLLVTYEDETTEYVPVTSELIPQEYSSCLTTPGIYEIEIVFKKEKAILNITIVEAATYMVEFYNGKEQLLDRQFVEVGEDAVAPSASAYTMYGYEFVGWDRTFTDVTEDIKVYGVYSKLITEDMNALIQGKMVDALDFMYSNDYVLTLANDNGGQLIYHFDEEKQVGFSQALGFSKGEINYIQNSSIEKIEIYKTDESTGEWQIVVDDLNDEGLTDEEKALVVMFGGEWCGNLFLDETIYTYSYTLTENRNIYTVEARCMNSIDSKGGVYLYFVFDDEKVLSTKIEDYDDFGELEDSIEYFIDYKTEDFVTIEDQDLALAIYNNARENMITKTSLYMLEEENSEYGYYKCETSVLNNQMYRVSDYELGFQTWIQKEQDVWYDYSIYESSTQEQTSYKRNISEEVLNNSVMEYVIDEMMPVFDEELLSVMSGFECSFENDVTKLTFTQIDEGYELLVNFYIENGLVTKSEQILPGEPLYTITLSYDVEDVEMVELPTDVEWIEN